MKKITTAFALLIFASIITYGQTNQYEALKNIPEGTLLNRFPSVKKGDDGKYTGTPSKEKYKIYHHNNMHGKLYALSIEKETDSKEKYDFRGPATNHYSEPSIIGGSENYGRGYVILGNTIYYLEKIKNWSNPSSYKISRVYTVRNDKGKKEKLTMKQRMALAKAKLEEASKGPKEITEVDHQKVLDDYFAAMAKKQSVTTLTSKEKSELSAIVKAEKDRIAKINTRNAEWEATEGKRIRELNARSSGSSDSKSSEGDSYSGQIYYKLSASSSASKVYIHYGSNAAYVTSTTRGSSASIKCQKGDVYYSYTGKKADMQSLGSVSPSDCGKTITVK